MNPAASDAVAVAAPALCRAEPPLRVLLVVEPGVDGVFRYVEELMKRLLGKSGIEPHLAYSSVRGSGALEALVALARGRGAQTLDLRVNNAPALGDARALWRLWKLARRLRPDVIHAHSSKAGVLARALRFLGIRARYFYTPHAYFQMHGRRSAKAWFFQSIERILARIGTTMNVSCAEAEYACAVLGLPESRRVVLLTGVDCRRFQPVAAAAEKNAARQRFGLPADVPLLGTVARYSGQKDPLTLYRALLGALAKRPAVHFAHLGQGELATQVDDLLRAATPEIRQRIHRREASDEPELFYHALDAFVLPSRYEGLALAPMEAMASGLPVILSECPGNDDFKGFGLDAVRWARPADPASLEAAILAWLDAGAKPNNHRRVVLENFEADENYARLIEVYGRVPQAN